MKNSTLIYSLLPLFFFLGINPVFAQEMKKEKIIFDCDLGDDIDDMYALALLLSSPEFEVMGLVMDYGNTPERAKMALKVLHEVGLEDIPVVVGRKTNNEFSPQYHWSTNFNKLQVSNKNAVDFIRDLINQYPNEINLVTVGPVPNMQDLLEEDKNILTRVKHIYAMFGSFEMGYESALEPHAEWNVKADVSASKAFVEADKKGKITFLPLDVTTYVRVEKENIALIQMRNSPLTDAISATYVLWRYMPYAKNNNYIPRVYDAVALGIILWPELFRVEDGYVTVDQQGMTLNDTSKKPNAKIALQINTDEFIRRMMERILLQNLERK